MVDLLIELQDQLALHFALEEAYGYFDDPIWVAPHISDLAESLRAEHVALYSELCDLAEQAGSLAEAGSPAGQVDLLEHWKTGAREIKTFRGHSQGVWTVAYSPDGLTLASGGSCRLVRRWEIETGRNLKPSRGPTHWEYAADQAGRAGQVD